MAGEGNPSTNIANIQMDINQVWDSNGDVATLGFQCVHDKGTWQYTTNLNGVPHWNPTSLACDPQNWATKAWHHVQLAGHREQCTDQTWGCVSYDYVVLDGNYSHITNWFGNSSFGDGWTDAIGDLILNFQVDGRDCPAEPGPCSSPYPDLTSTIYLDGMDMISWTQ